MNRDRLLAEWIAGELDSAGQQELLHELQADTDFTQEAAGQLQLDRLLGSLAVDQGDFTRELMLKIQSNASTPSTEKAVLSRLRTQRRWQRFGLGVAGLATALAITLMLIFWRPPQPDPKVRVLAAEDVHSLDVRALEDGHRVNIDNGILEISLGEKSRLVLEAPASFAVESVDVVRLFSGRCYAEMEKGSSGLRIKTPSGEVLDLGTRFGVEVGSSGATAVHVFEGEVELASQQNRSVLHEGEGAHWTDGKNFQVVAAEAERFVSRLPKKEQGDIKWMHWSFDEGSGDITTPQGIGYPEALVPASVHGARWIERNGTAALKFDGVDDWVETIFAGIGGNADRTVAAWVKLAPDFRPNKERAVVGWGNFKRLGHEDVPICTAWELGVGYQRRGSENFGRLRLAVGGPLTVGHKDLRDGQWHHVAAVYFSKGAPEGRGIVLLYVDGQLQHRMFGKNVVSVNTDVESVDADTVQFGRQIVLTNPNRRHFKGAIDEVFILDRALSGGELRDLMETNAIP